MYRTMLTIRRFEERCNHLYLQGRIPSTLHLYIGQEAVATGVCAHLRPDDYLYSTHRPHGHALAKGVSPRSIMAELYGKLTGCCRGKGGSMHVGDVSVGMFPAIAIVGANAPLAAGSALAAKRLTADRIAVSFMGDGALNEGAVHEAMNMAALWDLPVVFVCENNLYAASTPLATAFKNQDLAARAAVYGMPSLVVDGNDVEAVHQAAGQAVARARRREGPTFLEAQTYRLCGHSRSDPGTYRSKDEEAAWAARDPIPRLAGHLVQRGLATAAALADIEQQVIATLDDAVAFAEESPLPQPTDALDHVFWTASEVSLWPE
jgi:TPP-dependent pyruvate/acetoin dehydrogenase alpha subunit